MLGIHPESIRNFRNFRTHILLFEVLLYSTGIHPESTRNPRNPPGISGVQGVRPEYVGDCKTLTVPDVVATGVEAVDDTQPGNPNK
jgi:hypothetical protein